MATRVTDQEAALKYRTLVEKLALLNGVSVRELDRRVRDCVLPANPMRLLGAAIKTERLVKHMTRRQLASRAGISLQLLTDLERGFLSDLRLAAFFNIAMALGVTAEYLARDWSEYERRLPRFLLPGRESNG